MTVPFWSLRTPSTVSDQPSPCDATGVAYLTARLGVERILLEQQLDSGPVLAERQDSVSASVVW